MKLTFMGAAGTVTGSKYLIESAGIKVLLDCGLFQGLKALRLQNWEALSVPASSISAVILTHAHIDHSGYLPRLFKDGFRGKVFCTPPTAALCQILLMDSAKLMEEEARYANRRGFSKHIPAVPLFTSDDAEGVISKLEPVNFQSEFKVAGPLSACYGHAGHILGAANVVVSDGKSQIGFSGDIGRPSDPLMVEPEALAGLTGSNSLDALVVESTYGNRLHPNSDPTQSLAEAIILANSKGGSVLIPAFAVGRAQEIIYYLTKLKDNKSAPMLPVYLDSPMATDVTALYQDFPNDHKLSHDEYRRISNGVRYVRDIEESKQVQVSTQPKLVISASGMATGGRVLHYLKKMVPRTQDVILFAGYQAAGTRGASLLGGATEIKIHGEYFPVRAKILEIENLSAHADANEIVDWISKLKMVPKKVFITHGEPAAADALRLKLTDHFNWNCDVARQGQTVEI